MRTVATFSRPVEAQLFAAHLGGNGIEAILRDEHTVEADWLLSNAVGGVKVDVADDDYERAVLVARSLRPTVPAQATSGQKRKHTTRRYFRAFCVLLVVLYGLSEWFVGWIEFGSVFWCCVVIAAGIAAFMALFDL